MTLRKCMTELIWMAVWDVLKVYGVGRSLMNGMKVFHKDAKACIKVNGEISESFRGSVRDVPMAF